MAVSATTHNSGGGARQTSLGWQHNSQSADELSIIGADPVQNELYSRVDPLPARKRPRAVTNMPRPMELQILANAEPIPGYRLIERLGRGGYGEVWKAEAPGGMHKAIKFVAGDVDGFGDDGKAAEQEFKSLNRVKSIRHPFLLSIERFEVIDSQLVIVMELADRNLWDRFAECQRHGLPGVPRPELLRYMEEAAEALDLMNIHHQIQHLDVKPHNIFLVHQHVKVADFGLAKDLEGARADLTGGITPTYAPPETFEGWVSRQSDQYSLAIVFMEMLTGRRPFNGTNTRQLVMQHLTAIPDLSPLSPTDRGPIGRSLSKKPENRFATCAELVRALRGEEQASTVPPPPVREVQAQRAKSSTDTDVPAGPTQLAPPADRRGFPALVTPSTRSSVSASNSQLRRNLAAQKSAPKPNVARVERVGLGVLVPTLFVGVGGVGRAMLRAMRQLVAAQYGRPSLPHFRWLYLDTDPTAMEAAASAPAISALASDDVLHTPLRRPTHYLNREGMPAVETWLPQEELFRMPRTPATEGTRSLGRLALCDHYHVISHRVRTALESLVAEAPLDDADRMTKLGIRSSFPRVYIATSLAGGTGSGMYLDLAYLVRRELNRIGISKPQVVGLLGVPTLSADSREARGLENARAALAELHHFETSKSGYHAQFDTREGPVGDPERPFQRTFLLPLGSRFDVKAVTRTADVAGHVAFAELLTPIGRVAHPDGDETSGSAHSLVGIRRVSWPKAEIVRVASLLLARQTLQSWEAKSSGEPGATALGAVETQWGEGHFDRKTLGPVIDRHLIQQIGMDPEALVDGLLLPLSAPVGEGTTDIHRARAVLKRLIELLGRPGADEKEHPHEFGRLFATSVRELAAQGDGRLGGSILALIEQPGLRVAGAEDAVRLNHARLTAELARADREAAKLEEQALAEFIPLHHRLLAPAGEHSPRVPHTASDHACELRRWAMTRYQALSARACANVYRVWLGNLPEYARELSRVRNQIATITTQLDSARPTTVTRNGVCCPIFPDEVKTIEEASALIVSGLTPELHREFENGLQARIRHSFRSLATICNRSIEVGRLFLQLLTEHATHFLEARTTQMTASQLLTLQTSGSAPLRDKVAELIATSSPAALDPGTWAVSTQMVLAIPAGESEGRLTDLARNLCPGITFRTARSIDDLIVYQETCPVSLPTLPHMTAELPTAASETESRHTDSHSRTDVQWIAVGPP